MRLNVYFIICIYKPFIFTGYLLTFYDGRNEDGDADDYQEESGIEDGGETDQSDDTLIFDMSPYEQQQHEPLKEETKGEQESPLMEKGAPEVIFDKIVYYVS